LAAQNKEKSGAAIVVKQVLYSRCAAGLGTATPAMMYKYISRCLRARPAMSKPQVAALRARQKYGCPCARCADAAAN